MRSKTVKTILAAAVALTGITIGATTAASAAGGGNSSYEMVHKHWHFQGIRGSFDRAAAQRGYQVYREVCASCHALEQLSFRHLGDKGAPYFNEDYPNPNDNPYVKTFAADWSVKDIDADTGDVIERPGMPADKFPMIFDNAAAARASNSGALPPDLSVIVSARSGGADYLYNLLTAYGTATPDHIELTPGLYYNPVMDGEKIAMAAPLSDGILEYSDGTEATVEQMAADVTEFLAWSADPKMEQRKTAGFATMLYLIILSILMWFSYKRVWRDVAH